jgi:hypothetical protein
MSCDICNKKMRISYHGELHCDGCNLIYVNSNVCDAFGKSMSYVIFNGKNYSIDEWHHMLRLKAFW